MIDIIKMSDGRILQFVYPRSVSQPNTPSSHQYSQSSYSVRSQSNTPVPHVTYGHYHQPQYDPGRPRPYYTEPNAYVPHKPPVNNARMSAPLEKTIRPILKKGRACFTCTTSDQLLTRYPIRCGGLSSAIAWQITRLGSSITLRSLS